ncbi:uncharacterized protein [Macrobrachium rosenbergii]|uniref:uncharacterized protein n=1 Tax=Macrobrachium rosenbergii TaxID=79674 RepID=UPI0034D397FF
MGKPNQVIPKAPLNPIPAIGEPFVELVIDVVGPLPRTKTGFTHLLTIMDRASRFPEAFPMKKITSRAVFEKLIEFFSRYGLPRKIQTDCGTNFTSKVFRGKCAELAVQHTTSVPYHPESQGVVERFHQTLKSVLKKYCYEQGEDWEKGLPFALFAIRNHPNSSTGVAPFELVFGHRVRGPLEIFHEMLASGRKGEMNVVEFVENLQKKFARAWKFARENLASSQAVMKSNFDRNTKVRSFEPGELVLVLSTDSDNFLEPRYKGPWKVLRKLSEVNYEIEAAGTKRKCRIFHINRLKSYFSGAKDPLAIVYEPVSMVVEPPEDSFEDLVGQVSSDALFNNIQNLEILKGGLDHLEATQRDIINLICSFPEIFQSSPGRTRLLQHDVDVGSASPVKQSPYRLNPMKRDIVEEEIKYMLKHDLVQPSISPWSSPIVLVKKSDGKYHMCVDYRKVNASTKNDSFPLPRIDDCLNQIGSAKFITKLDLLKGYWQVPLSDRAREISAFVTPFGLYECKKPFIIAVDASDVGIGGVLFQRNEAGEVRPVSYFSHKLLAVEKRYSTIEKEALALVRTLLHFKPYVTNFSFPIEIWTDHNPLVFIEQMKGSNQRILRWALQLQEFSLVIKHIKGSENRIPDALSRVVVTCDLHAAVRSFAEAVSSATIVSVPCSRRRIFTGPVSSLYPGTGFWIYMSCPPHPAAIRERAT